MKKQYVSPSVHEVYVCTETDFLTLSFQEAPHVDVVDKVGDVEMYSRPNNNIWEEEW